MQISRIHALVISILAVWAVELRAAESEQRLELQVPEARPEIFERVEISISGVPSVENPFDPGLIRVDLEVTPPSGKAIQLPAFFSREFDRKLEGGREVLTPVSGEGWFARWLPMEAGRHQLTVTAKAGGTTARGGTAIDVKSGDRPGLVRVDAEGKRYFRLDSGQPLFLNGLCACWHGSRGTYDYDDWLRAYEKAGINYIRIWMWPQAFGIEWDRNDRVRYRLDSAWTLDRVLEEAERRGIYVMLCLDYHGMFEVKADYWGGNNFWPRHPYNAANGGPCQTQNDFFTRDDARELYSKRLRYVVARWSAFPNLLAWEFFNEIDNEYAYLKHPDVMAWHADMGRRLRALDPYDHLISSSFTGGSVRQGLYELPEMDFAQYHSYNEKHPARMTAGKTQRFYEQYKKPFFVSEYGTDWKGWKPDTDPHLRALHQAIWSGAFTGAAGTGMTWWWESIHSADLYRHWSALAAFLEGTGVGGSAMQPARFESTSQAIAAFGVADRDEALVWLLDRACDWPEGAMNPEPKPVTGATLTVGDLEDGAWSIQWWDTTTGTPTQSGHSRCVGGLLRLDPPAFRVDIAGRLRRSSAIER